MKSFRWKILLTESFIPFLFILISLIFGLLVLDNYIENRDDLTLINLNREQDIPDEPFNITQKIELQGGSQEELKWVSEINNLMDRHSWNLSIQKIIQRKNKSQNLDYEVNLTLAYLYYKTKDYQKGVALLQSLKPYDHPRYYYNMGLLLSHQPGLIKEAIINFEIFLTFKNESYEAMMNMANLYKQQDDYKNAIPLYLKSTEISHLDRKANAYYWAAVCFEKTKDVDQALKYLNMAIRLNPEMPSARVRRAKLNLKTSPKKSISQLEKLAKIFPDYAFTYLAIADYYTDKNENNKALKWIRKGIQQAPNSRQLKSSLGSIYLRMDEYEKAGKIFENLSGQFPREEIYVFKLARCYYGLNDYKKAIEYYDKALNIRPVYYEAFINLGVIYSKLGNLEKAISFYNKSISIKSTDPTVYFNLGILYSKEGRNNSALESYKKAVLLQANYPEAYFNMASLYVKRDDHLNAEKAYLEAIRLNPKYSSAYYNLSLLYEKRHLLEKGMSILDRGIKINGDLKLMNRLGHEQIENKKLQDALVTFQNVLRIEPENDSALMELARLESDLKNFSESKKYIEKYLYLKPKDPEGRYVYLLDLYNLKSYDEANRQYEILTRIAPGFRDSERIANIISSRIKTIKRSDI